MKRYTVVWHKDSQDDLANLWVISSNRAAISAAANQIDSYLATNAESKGTSIAEALRELDVPPLRVHFAVSEADRIVRVVYVATS